MADNAREQTGNQAGHGQPPYHGVPANALPLTASEDRQWATLAHFGGILGCVPSLLIYLIFKDRGPFTAQESKEALNFTLPPTLAAVLCNLLVFIPVVGNLFAVLATVIWIAVTCFSVAAGSLLCGRVLWPLMRQPTIGGFAGQTSPAGSCGRRRRPAAGP